MENNMSLPVPGGEEEMPLENNFDNWLNLLCNMAMAAKKKGIKTEWIEAVSEYAQWKSDDRKKTIHPLYPVMKSSRFRASIKERKAA